ncbi:protein of unknown function DUF4179 [Pseudobacteroides cellulosolvens ATCC 35603 = DSM 2933]|uniref:DUF4179 domain-containing protein n=1 Tax=Pseudobacteroides cellulosolvens ATCC 35603 = DSM 2933 TaxID=398512 RepID=A0A0L6JJE6_9FIRM|nr:protein of unknown function DUF4179 [Pseudobacteroides cellulosolvens ATCC 35603 = DSM 2933]
MLFFFRRNLKKEAKDITPEYWERLSKEIGIDESHNRKFVLRPVFVVITVLFILIGSISVYAIGNWNIGYYISLVFGNNSSIVSGNIINQASEMEGIELNVNALLREEDNIILFYTLTDKEKKIFTDRAFLSNCVLNVNGKSNFGRSSMYETKNGVPNYIVFNYDSLSLKKGKNANLEFKVNSLRLPERSNKHMLPLDTSNYTLDNTSGMQLEKIETINHFVKVSIRVPKNHIINIPIIKNKITGKEYISQSDSIHNSDQENFNLYLMTYGPLDTSNKEDYELIINTEKVYNFSKPLSVKFDTKFEDLPRKVPITSNLYVSSALVKSVNVYQMSVMIELVNPINGIVQEDEMFLKKQIQISYDDGTTINKISDIMSSPEVNNGEFRYCVMFSSPIDYTKKPILKIGDLNIPIYKN